MSWRVAVPLLVLICIAAVVANVAIIRWVA